MYMLPNRCLGMRHSILFRQHRRLTLTLVLTSRTDHRSGSDMSPDDLPALTQALDLIHAPNALEVLQALTENRDPYEIADAPSVTAAIAMLCDLGAATIQPPPTGHGMPTAAITRRGRALYHRLVEIEQGVNLQPGQWDPDR
jgi:hypothetical protein